MGCVWSADVFARVIHVGGTDEYGTVTETMEEGCTPQEICDKYHAIHRDVYGISFESFDEFGRNSTPQHTQICQAIFSKLMEKERLLKDSRKQF
ncbi:hypothetical protein MKW92_038250 [Papaver armeniacum]|nr:hypothetical protein MKW92_038250 [Papaver armeniacum]